MLKKLIVGAGLLIATAFPTQAAVDEKFKQGWEDGFSYIDQATYAIFLDFGLSFVPLVEQAEKLALRYASTMASRFSALGLDARKYPLTSVDAVQITRVVLALDYGSSRKASPMIKAELLAYALCPWTSDACRADVKAAIYARRGWKV